MPGKHKRTARRKTARSLRVLGMGTSRKSARKASRKARSGRKSR